MSPTYNIKIPLVPTLSGVRRFSESSRTTGDPSNTSSETKSATRTTETKLSVSDIGRLKVFFSCNSSNVQISIVFVQEQDASRRLL